MVLGSTSGPLQAAAAPQPGTAPNSSSCNCCSEPAAWCSSSCRRQQQQWLWQHIQQQVGMQLAHCTEAGDCSAAWRGQQQPLASPSQDEPSGGEE